MKIKNRSVGKVTVVDLKGPLSFGDGETVFRESIAAVLDEGASSILLNFEKVEFIDSSGVGALVTCLTRVNRAGGKLKGLHPSPMVAKVLKITGVYSLIEFYSDEKQAIASF